MTPQELKVIVARLVRAGYMEAAREIYQSHGMSLMQSHDIVKAEQELQAMIGGGC